MKKIIALVLVLTLSLFCFAACKKDKGGNDNNNGNGGNTPTEKTYTLSIAVDSVVDENNKVTNTVAVLLLDESNKIVAVRLDTAETTITVENNEVVDANVTSKVELGDGYPMTAGSFAKQTKAFEDYIVGKTADEVTNLDTALISGCTMPKSPTSFKVAIAKAFATANKITFKTSETVTLGAAISMSVSGGKASADFAGTVLAGGKVVAAILDSCERTFTVADGVATADDYTGTKADKGDNYTMPKGNWLNQAKAFANSAVGKTTADLVNLETVSDALASAGCTMEFTTAGYKATLIKAAGNAR